MKFFNNCTSLDEAKKLYRQLAIENHPDRGGNEETMKEINKYYQLFIVFFMRNEGKTDDEINNELNLSDDYKEAINKIAGLEGIEIEIVGNWIWVTGNTLQHRFKLKSAGYFFAPKKKCWYFRTEEFKTKSSKGTKDLDTIKSKYGSIKVPKLQFNRLK